MTNKLKIDSLSITANQVDRFAVSKLFFDISQGSITVANLKLLGGFTDTHF